MKVLVLANQDDLQLSNASRSAIAAAKQINSKVDVLLISNHAPLVKIEVASISGVELVISLEVDSETALVAEQITSPIVDIAKDYSHIVAPAVTLFKNVLPRVAALLDVDMVSEVTAIIDQNTYQRPLYAGSINGVVLNTASVQISTIRPTAFAPDWSKQEAASIQVVNLTGESALAKVIETRIQKSDRPDLASARIVVTGGRSLGSAEKFHETIFPLATKLNAAIGATRAAVDAGFAPNDVQVGQTGTVVAPEIYLALGVSGAAQHIAGIKGSKTIVAINHDPDAQIFQWADYGLVADLFDTAKVLQEAL